MALLIASSVGTCNLAHGRLNWGKFMLRLFQVAETSELVLSVLLVLWRWSALRDSRGLAFQP